MCCLFLCLQNPALPRCWFNPDLQQQQQQVLKPHQLDGLKFMWDCLVLQHCAAELDQNNRINKQNNNTNNTENNRAQNNRFDSDDSDSDFVISDDESDREARPGHDQGTAADPAAAAAGGCILAHSMGLGKSFQTVAMLWLYFQKM